MVIVFTANGYSFSITVNVPKKKTKKRPLCVSFVSSNKPNEWHTSKMSESQRVEQRRKNDVECCEVSKYLKILSIPLFKTKKITLNAFNFFQG